MNFFLSKWRKIHLFACPYFVPDPPVNNTNVADSFHHQDSIIKYQTLNIKKFLQNNNGLFVNIRCWYCRRHSNGMEQHTWFKWHWEYSLALFKCSLKSPWEALLFTPLLFHSQYIKTRPPVRFQPLWIHLLF